MFSGDELCRLACSSPSWVGLSKLVAKRGEDRDQTLALAEFLVFHKRLPERLRGDDEIDQLPDPIRVLAIDTVQKFCTNLLLTRQESSLSGLEHVPRLNLAAARLKLSLADFSDELVSHLGDQLRPACVDLFLQVLAASIMPKRKAAFPKPEPPRELPTPEESAPPIPEEVRAPPDDSLQYTSATLVAPVDEIPQPSTLTVVHPPTVVQKSSDPLQPLGLQEYLEAKLGPNSEKWSVMLKEAWTARFLLQKKQKQ